MGIKGQIPWNKGLKNCFSKETRKKMSESAIRRYKMNPEHMKKLIEMARKRIGILHPNYGKKLSLEHRKKLSEAKKGKYYGKNNPFYGKTHTKKVREIISKKLKGRIGWNRGLTKKTDWRIKKQSEGSKGVKKGFAVWQIKEPEKFKEFQRECSLRSAEKQMNYKFISKQEQIMRKLLPIDFLHNKRLGRVGVPDFHSSERKIVVEVDGIYWHNKPSSKMKDKGQTAYWQKMGYQVFRITDKDVNEYMKPLLLGEINE